jgi:4-diphosphocytidyl-2-C-methyl-D-erythritol kinase
MRVVTAFAPAKINLALHVAAPQADGRHPLTSIVTFADVGDEVQLEAGDGFSVSGPFAATLATEPNNLVLRALALAAPGRAAKAHLVKRLPVASGIGGGSADAAATLRAARAFFGLSAGDDELAARALGLGADLPVCIGSRPALVQGIGEQLTTLDLPPIDAVLINPLIPLSTASVFQRYDELGRFGDLDMPSPLAPAFFKDSRNDLEAAACSLVPEIAEILGGLRADKRVHLGRMSGSGATCFGLVPDRDSGLSLAADLSRRFPGAWVVPTQLGNVDVTPRES